MRSHTDGGRLFGNEATAAWLDAHAGTLVRSGTDVVETGEFTVDASSGTIAIEGALQDVETEGAVLSDPGADGYRVDTVTRDGDGELQVTEGDTETLGSGTLATAPPRPSGHVLLAHVRVLEDGINQLLDGRVTQDAIATESLRADSYRDVVATHSSTVGTPIDLEESNWHELVLDSLPSGVTWDISIEGASTAPPGNTALLYIDNGSESNALELDWPDAVVWPEGDAIEEVGAEEDIEISLMSPDGGSTWRARSAGGGWA